MRGTGVDSRGGLQLRRDSYVAGHGALINRLRTALTELAVTPTQNGELDQKWAVTNRGDVRTGAAWRTGCTVCRPKPKPMNTPPKRILFMDHTASLGGGEIALLNLVRHLDNDRYVPVALLFADGPLRQRLEDAGVETHVIELDPRVTRVRKDSLGLNTLLRFRDLFTSASFVRKLVRFVRSQQIDLVHTNSLKSDILGGVAARIARKPLIWHVRDRIAADYLPKPVVFLFQRLSRVVPDIVIANSRATLDTLGLPDLPHGEAVYSGIDLDTRMRVVHDGTHAAQRNGADSTATLVGSGRRSVGLVGRISPWKGQHVFVRAAAAVHRRFPDVRFQIIGSAMFAEGSYESEVRLLVDELELREHVEFTGFREDVGALVAELEILVHASTTGEPFGQVIVEGMAAGKPVVATNGGGVPEIVLDGVTGFLVPMGDPDAMAFAICRLLDDKGLGERMGGEGQRRVQEQFTIQRTALHVEKIYDGLLNAGQAAAGEPDLPRGGRSAPGLLDRPLTFKLGLMIAAIAVAHAIGWFLQSQLGPHAPVTILFLFVVVAAARVLGMGTAMVGVALATAAMIHLLPPTGWALRSNEYARVWTFVASGMILSYLVGTLHRMTRRAECARADADQTQRAWKIMAAVSRALSVARNTRELFEQMAYLANRHFADWCLIHLLDEDGSLCCVKAAHSVASADALAKRFEGSRQRLDSLTPAARAIRKGAPWGTQSDEAARGSVVFEDSSHERLAQELGGLSLCLAVPLMVGGASVGAITFFRGANRGPFGWHDVECAAEFANRCAQALRPYREKVGERATD
jgi:glycosyltransferase involved in cell wall biosynthesis